MLKISPYVWILLILVMMIAGVYAATASLLPKSNQVDWRVDSIEVSGRAAGGMHLAFTGEGLHRDLRAMLIPETNVGGTTGKSVDFAFPLYRFATDGRIAVASTRDQHLLVLDVTENDRPAVLGKLKIFSQEHAVGANSLTALELIGSRVVAAKNNIGLTLVDVSNPQTPRELDFLKLNSNILDIKASGEFAYLASDTLGLAVVTFAGDRLVCRQVPGSPPAYNVALERRRLVTMDFKGNLAFYHLGAEGQPKLIGTAKVAEEIRDLVLTQEALYLCTSGGDLLTFSLDNWPQLRLTGRLSLKGHPLKLEWMPATRTLLCSLAGSGVAGIDVSQATAPRLKGVLSLAKTPLNIKAYGTRAFMLGIQGLKIFSALEFFQELSSLKIDNSFSLQKGRPSLLRWNSTGFVYNRKELKPLTAGIGEGGMKAPGTDKVAPFLILPDDNHGLKMLAIREGLPTSEVVGRIQIPDSIVTKDKIQHDQIRKFFWRDGRVYVLAWDKIFIFGVDSSGRLTSTEEVLLNGMPVNMAWCAPGYLVVAFLDQGLQVVDVSKVGASKVVGGYPVPKHQKFVGAVKDLLVDGSRLYVARARLGVEVYDLSIPASPQLMQRIDTPGYATSLDLNDGLLLVVDSDQGIYVIDVSGRQAVAIGSYRLPTLPKQVLYDGGSLFITNTTGGILRLPPPLRFANVEVSSERRASLTLPSGVVAGRYRLALYDNKGVTSLPVTLQ